MRVARTLLDRVSDRIKKLLDLHYGNKFVEDLSSEFRLKPVVLSAIPGNRAN